MRLINLENTWTMELPHCTKRAKDKSDKTGAYALYKTVLFSTKRTDEPIANSPANPTNQPENLKNSFAR